MAEKVVGHSLRKINIRRQNWMSWMLVVGWMGVIFYLSHQPASESSALSNGVVQTVITFFETIFYMSLADNDVLHYIVRKAAHLFAYFILSLLVLRACRMNFRPIWGSIRVTLVVCILYAMSDEIHQLFIVGRSGQVTDVLIDALGACLGIGCYFFTARLYTRIGK